MADALRACRAAAPARRDARTQGSVIKYEGKKGVTWTYVIDAGRDVNGKRVQKWKRGLPTKKAVEAAMQLQLHPGSRRGSH